MTATVVGTAAFSFLYGFVLAWAIQEYRRAGDELKRVREDFEETKRRYPKKEVQV